MCSRSIFLSLILILAVKPYLFAKDDNFELFKLLKNCDSEIETYEFDGSCFLLGIKAAKKQNLQLFSKIETLCIDVFAPKIFESYEIFEDYLAYFPKCKYVILSKIASTQENSFDSGRETKELVRFLNSQ